MQKQMSPEQWERYQRALDILRLRKRAYQLAFSEAKDNEALKDLARFCHIGRAPYHPDRRKNDILLGRQETYYRIQNYLTKEPDELYEIYNNPQSIEKE